MTGGRNLGRWMHDGRAFRRDPLRFVNGLDARGDLVRFRAGLTEFTLVKDPPTIHRILVTDNDMYGEGKWTLRGRRVMRDCLITAEGARHRDRRLLIQPSFDQRRLAEHASEMVGRSERLGGRWQDGARVEARTEMAALALTIAGATLFSLDLERESAGLVPALMTMLREVPRPAVPWPMSRRFVVARRRVDPIALRAVTERRGEKPDGDDVLSALMSARVDGGRRLTDAEVADELVSLLMAAVDTTPGTLAWTWFALARCQDVEQRLHAELEGVLGGRPPTNDDVPRLSYLSQVVREVLRLYPPVHFIDRRPLVDVELDGRRVAAGSFLLLSPLLTQRDPQLYPDPTEFRPERWSRESAATRPAYAFFPFGAGPHTCVGNALARMELTLVIATLAQRWRLRPAPELPAQPSPQTTAFPMILERR